MLLFKKKGGNDFIDCGLFAAEYNDVIMCLFFNKHIQYYYPIYSINANSINIIRILYLRISISYQ